jgi:protein-tyrosine phosphatase
MIDLHSHVLPNLDDGAKDLAEAVRMCHIAEQDGIKILAATPHFRPTVYDNNQENILPAVDRLQEEIDRKGISLRIVPGVDIRVSPEVIPFLEQNPRLLFGGRYALMEFPAQCIPPSIEDFFFRMRLKGFTPIITHPERNGDVQNDPKMLEAMVDKGALVQVTAMSLTGDFGDQVRATAFRLVKSGLAHVVASDAHSPRHRRPVLSKALRAVENLIGPERARMMVEEIPRKILQGEVVEISHAEDQPSRLSLLKKLFPRLSLH